MILDEKESNSKLWLEDIPNKIPRNTKARGAIAPMFFEACYEVRLVALELSAYEYRPGRTRFD